MRDNAGISGNNEAVAATWRIECFGGLRAILGEGTVSRFRTRKAAQLLACLALAPKNGRTREALAEALWPDEDSLTARNRLKQTLSLLRTDLSALGEPPLVAEGKERLRLADGVAVDAAEFDAALKLASRAGSFPERLAALTRASALYVGPLLPETYDDGTLAERGRLEEAFAGAEEERVGLLLERGDLSEARAAAHRAARLAPESERAEALRERVRAARPASRRSAKRRPRVPAALTPLFGRTDELRRIASLLSERRTRLVTLLGTGGIGKTRLSQELARACAEAFDGAVWFVPLSALGTADGVPAAILDALRLPGEEDGPAEVAALEKVCARLAELPTALLVLDNLEHLGDGARPVVQGLLERLPGLSVLATSRQPLGVRGESRVELGPLDEENAVKWFVHQAQAARSEFLVNDANAESVRAVCRRLDGLPLALELAAAWSGTLSPVQIAARLERPMELLVRPGGPGPDPRHAALAETISASFRMLPEEAAEFWLALSVFRGGWWLAAAEAVTGRADAPGLLATLRERSLVRAFETPEGMRYSLLAPLREFAEAALDPEAAGELRRRHADHYLAWSHRVASVEFHADAPRSFALLEGEEANTLAALLDGLGGSGERLGFAIHVFQGLAWHWWVRGKGHLFAAIVPAIESLAGRLDEFQGGLRGAALWLVADHQADRGENEESEARLREALALLRESGESTTGVCELLASLLSRLGRFGDAIALLESELADAERAGATDSVASWLGRLVAACRDASDGEKHYGYGLRCRDLYAAQGKPGWAGKIDIELALPLCERGAATLAESRLRGAVDFFESHGETWNQADAEKTLGLVLHRQSRADDANAALERAAALWENLGCAADAARARGFRIE